MEPLDLLADPPAVLAGRPLPAQFPGLRGGERRFDGPGGTLVHGAVRDAVSAYLGSSLVANDHGGFPASDFSDRLVDWATDRVRTLLGTRAGRVVFGANMTTLTTMFTRALADTLRPGDDIVCTELDHEANIVPWQALARARGARVRLARLPASGVLPTAAVTDLLGPATRWVAVTAASNALGTVPDLPAVVAAAHAVGARVFVDGVQAVAHRPVNLDDLGADAFVTSAYKWYGPHCAALWLSETLTEELRLPEQVPSADTTLPGRLQLGTTGFEAVLGTGVAAEILLHWDRDLLQERERKLTGLLLDGLAAIRGVRLLGPGAGDDRVPVVSFQLAGRTAAEVAAALAAVGVCVWHGAFYASAALRAVAPDAPEAVRAGIARYTTEDDVTALCRAVATVAGERP